MDTPLFFLLCHALLVYGVLSFGSEGGFGLTASRYIFVPNDNVTFTCTKGTRGGGGGDDSPRDLVFPSSAGITWERNGQSLFSTTKEGDACHVRPETVLGRPVVTQRDLEAVTCTEDDTSVRVTIRNVTVSAAGDRWVCSKFPFQESNSVALHNFVPLTDVTLSVQDHFPDDVNTGVLMTLVCLASPCNPRPSLTWRLESRDGHALPLPEQKRTHAQVDRYGRVVLAVELGLRADPIYENATVTCSGTNALNSGGQATPITGGGDSDGDGDGSSHSKEKAWIDSESLKLTVKRPPRILLTVNPANEVTEGTVVTLTCGAHGHPRPEVRWRKEGGFLPGGLMEARTPIIRLNPARAPDQGQYTCRAFNGVQPEAANSVYLTVNEPKRELEVSDKNRTTEVTDEGPDRGGDREDNSASNEGDTNNNENDNDNDNNNDNNNNDIDNNNEGTASKMDVTSSAHGEDDDDDDDGANGGTIAAIVISVLVLLACLALLLLWVITRRGKQGLTSPSSIVSLFPQFAEKTMTAPRAGLYVPRRASQRPTTMTPITLDAFPQYLELPPAPSPPSGILNRGYGMPGSSGSRVIRGKSGRPLPAAPIAVDDITANPLTYGYDEIRDVSNDEGRAMTSADGYEVPVLLAEEDEEVEDGEWEDEDEDEEEEGDEGIYDVPRKGSSAQGGKASGSAVQAQARSNAMYMNEDSFNTHM